MPRDVLMSDADRDVLRRLAGRVAEIAASQEMAETRRLWKAHNTLQPGRPCRTAHARDRHASGIVRITVTLQIVPDALHAVGWATFSERSNGLLEHVLRLTDSDSEA